MRRFSLPLFLSAAIAGIAPAAASADPPRPPGGCSVVVNTPAASTGAPQAQQNKFETFTRLCT